MTARRMAAAWGLLIDTIRRMQARGEHPYGRLAGVTWLRGGHD